MAEKEKKKSAKKQGPKKGLAYFSTRVLKRAVAKGTKDKALVAKKIMGYTVKQEGEWVVKEYADGRIVKIKNCQISNGHLVLSSTNSVANLRMRVFAVPNGSGKSTIIKTVRDYKTNNRKIDFGIYINADDIVVSLTKKNFKFSDYEIKTTPEEFVEIVCQSGLINDGFSKKDFLNSFKFDKGGLILQSDKAEELAQIIADFLRKKLLQSEKKFSFETVFSHPSKLDIMRLAKEKGYKV